MNLEWYYTFLKVAKYENYRKAATELFTTQTTVFNHIKKLEGFLNVELFDNVGRNIILNENGKLFYPIAIETITTYERGLSRIKNSNKYDYNLNIAVTTYIASYIIPKFLPIFFKVAPNINISIFVVDKSMAREVEEGRYDIGITRELSGLKNLSYQRICEGQIKLVVPDIAENKNINDEIEYFKKYRIFSDNHPTYWKELKSDILKLVSKADFCSISSVNATENLIKSKQGISYLPTYILKDGDNEHIKFLNSKHIKDPISFTYMLWNKESSEIQLFLKLFSRFIKNEQDK
ncbi:LysR family transcriptional regulator [Orenia metallireducens]|uniref:Transcriptional regulator, LysR family n=1 Tax=Orenia metallireducens TaxID=1413210 RepID=A0A285GPZ5_9FIRM|nr:LysR family transcriptional regulator [Orenia metallireducens]PRX29915.1 LysR family transcriptional regulator [Orenia metallireducens]SNY25639.1 transcriptional regulator, LysR family [Orenia metallireducens]